MTRAEKTGFAIGRVLGDALVMATVIVLWEALGSLGVLAYFTLRLAVGFVRRASR